MNIKKIHSLLAPSSSHRWLNCLGAIPLVSEKGLDVSKESPLATEGTEAHAKLENCLKTLIRTNVLEPTGDEAVDYAVWFLGVTDLITKGSSRSVECKVDLRCVGIDRFGTCDFSCVVGNTLHVVDYKHGRYVDVEAEYNTQLMLYAIGILCSGVLTEDVVNSVDNIMLTIIQPRVESVDKVKQWSLSKDQLFEFKRSVEAKVKLILEGSQVFTTGGHCKYCPAKSICKAYVDDICSNSNIDITKPLTYDKATTLTEEQIHTLLRQKKRIIELLDSTEDYMLHRLLSGEHVEGFYLEPKKTRRKFANEKHAIQVISEYIDKADLSDTKMLSPAQLYKNKNIPKHVIDDLLYVPSEDEVEYNVKCINA